MKCTICGNTSNNKTYLLHELMFGFKDEFNYFQCAECSCFQILEIPSNMEKYYPSNYYSFDNNEKSTLKRSSFKKLQFDHISSYHPSLFGAIASFKYNPKTYQWFKNLNVHDKKIRILDIGCGSGSLVKQLYRVGFENTTGIDPYVKEDKIYSENLRILKKTVFEITDKFDLIMMHHSLEHMPDHPEVLKQIHSLLNKGGKLLIRIPIMSQTLFNKYGILLASLDPPRHFIIHSMKSIQLVLQQTGFKIFKTEYDAEAFDLIASEQYERGIRINDPNSYFINKRKSIFSRSDISSFKKSIKLLNEEGESSGVALYIEKRES